MTLDEFDALSADEQMVCWTMQGRYLASRYVSQYVVKLYAISTFYVEVWHNINTNQVEQLLSFSVSMALDVYLTDIWLNLD